MRFIQYSIAWFTSALIVAMTGQVSVAFTITPSQPGATANWKRASGYVTEDFFGKTLYGTTEVSTRLWTEPLPLGGSQIFNTTLLNWSIFSEQGFLGWDFKPAQQELMGNFEILNYVACAPQDPCGIESPPPNNTPRYDGVGALININYHPAPTDPQPGQKRIHWIQIVRANCGKLFGLLTVLTLRIIYSFMLPIYYGLRLSKIILKDTSNDRWMLYLWIYESLIS